MTTRLINFKNSTQHGSNKPSFQLSGSESKSMYKTYSKRSEIGSKSSMRNTHNISQQYQKFKIALAKSKQKQTISPNMNQRNFKKYASQSFVEGGDQNLNQGELMDNIRRLEARIRETKRNLLHERELNAMLTEENQNLRLTNNIIDKSILQNIKANNMTQFIGNEVDDNKNKNSGALSFNARLTENIYENFMMKDLKTEFQRTQGQINLLNDNMSSIQDDIGSIRIANK